MTNDKKHNALELLEKLSKAYDMIRRAQSKKMYGKNLTIPQFSVLEIL